MIQVWNMFDRETSWKGKSDDVDIPSILGNPYDLGKRNIGSRPQSMEEYKKLLSSIAVDGVGGRFAGAARVPDLCGRHSFKALDVQNFNYRCGVWNKLQVLVWRHLNKEEINLVCSCKPRLCHADIIAGFIQRLAKHHPAIAISPEDAARGEQASPL